MPTPPDVGIITRYVLENPWPLAGLLLVAAAVLLITGLRTGNTGRLSLALVPAFAAMLVVVAGLAVTTAGEHAEGVVRAFVTSVEEEDIVAAADAISEDGSVAVGSVGNPGFDKDFIIANLAWLGGRFSITANRITRLDAYTVDDSKAEIHLGLRTQSDRGVGPAVTRWVIDVRRRSDGEWLIHRITWIDMNGKKAESRWMPAR